MELWTSHLVSPSLASPPSPSGLASHSASLISAPTFVTWSGLSSLTAECISGDCFPHNSQVTVVVLVCLLITLVCQELEEVSHVARTTLSGSGRASLHTVVVEGGLGLTD